jgi:hypothetical protein
VSEETWHQARLIPTSGINGAEEQERRATSALLAVMTAVREFGRAVLQYLKAWSAAPPKLREEPEPPRPPAVLSSTSLSSQDGAEEPAAVAIPPVAEDAASAPEVSPIE